jgi:hypothetical protein
MTIAVWSCCNGGNALGQVVSATPVSESSEDPSVIQAQAIQGAIQGRTGSVEAERPQLADISPIVPRRRFQLEAGYTFLADDSAGIRLREHVFPGLLARLSVTDNVEFRVGWPGIVWDSLTDRATGIETTDSGAADIDLGIKLDVLDQSGYRPQLSLITSLAFPTGSDDISAERVQPLASIAYSWVLDDRWILGGTTGLGAMNERGDRFREIHQSIAVQRLITSRLGAYGEWFALFRAGSEDDRPQHYLDGGVTFLVTEDLELNWRTGFGINDRAQDFFTGVGFSVRF